MGYACWRGAPKASVFVKGVVVDSVLDTKGSGPTTARVVLYVQVCKMLTMNEDLAVEGKRRLHDLGLARRMSKSRTFPLKGPDNSTLARRHAPGNTLLTW